MSPTVLAQPVRQPLARELVALQKDLTRLKNPLEAVESGVSHPGTSLKRRIAALEKEKQGLEQENKQTHAYSRYHLSDYLLSLESLPRT